MVKHGKTVKKKHVLHLATKKMVIALLWILMISVVAGVNRQNCTLDQFVRNASNIVNSTEVFPYDHTITINSKYYNCLSKSDTSDHYSSMSVSILYIRSDDSNIIHEVRYNLQCNNNVWEIVGNQSIALRNNNTRYCEDCTDQIVNEYRHTIHTIGLLYCCCTYSIIISNPKQPSCKKTVRPSKRLW